MKVASYTTLRIGGSAAYVVSVRTRSQIAEVVCFARQASLPLVVLGGGSNSIFPDGYIPAVVARMRIGGYKIIRETGTHVWVRIGAGMNWDRIVRAMVKKGFTGIEALSHIPGTAGATPIQNVGAYGVEIAHTLQSVEVFDRTAKKFTRLSRAQCKFSYRWSVFKEQPERFIIVSIVLKLSKGTAKIPKYTGLKEYMKNHDYDFTAELIRRAVIRMRAKTLPNPLKIPNAGSFFKNPIISEKKYAILRKKYPDIVSFRIKNGTYKLAAGWLIDQCGLRGVRRGHFGTYGKNALVIIHDGKGSAKELKEFTTMIQDNVRKKFGVKLTPEPVFVFEEGK